MSSLGDFSKRPKTGDRGPRPDPVSRPVPAAPPAPSAPRPAFNRDRCPAGWDEGIWHLALLFEQYAHADGIELRVGRPVIYSDLMALDERYRVRHQRFVQVVTGCERRHLPKSRADRCVLHTREDVTDRSITWIEMFEVIMAEFWSRYQDAHALDEFRQRFAEYGTMAVRHWQSLDVARAIDARPKPPRAIVQRKTAGATMPVGSKEGE